jgi:hypothetical protein
MTCHRKWTTQIIKSCKSSYYYIYGMYQWTMLKFLDCLMVISASFSFKLAFYIIFEYFVFLYNISNTNGNYLNIWRNITYFIFKFYCKSRATDFLCSWFIANMCGTGQIGILSKGLIVFIFFRVTRKKNLWLNKPMSARQSVRPKQIRVRFITF